jgi:hypothetical protein
MEMRNQRHAPAALPADKRPGTHFIRGWVGPRVGVDMCGKSRLYRDSIPGPSSPQRVAVPTQLSRHLQSAIISYVQGGSNMTGTICA